MLARVECITAEENARQEKSGPKPKKNPGMLGPTFVNKIPGRILSCSRVFEFFDLSLAFVEPIGPRVLCGTSAGLRWPFAFGDPVTAFFQSESR
jgi:hypothetical protein